MANHEINRYICAVCGGTEEDEHGMCAHGHDNWMELEGQGILPDQAETFEANLGIPIITAIKALNGDKTSMTRILEAHEMFISKSHE